MRTQGSESISVHCRLSAEWVDSWVRLGRGTWWLRWQECPGNSSPFGISQMWEGQRGWYPNISFLMTVLPCVFMEKQALTCFGIFFSNIWLLIANNCNRPLNCLVNVLSAKEWRLLELLFITIPLQPTSSAFQIVEERQLLVFKLKCMEECLGRNNIQEVNDYHTFKCLSPSIF